MANPEKGFWRDTGEKARIGGAIVALVGVAVENATLASLGLLTFVAAFVGLETTKPRK